MVFHMEDIDCTKLYNTNYKDTNNYAIINTKQILRRRIAATTITIWFIVIE